MPLSIEVLSDRAEIDTLWLGRAMALQAAVARRTGDQVGADRLLARAEQVLDRIGTPARARPTCSRRFPSRRPRRRRPHAGDDRRRPAQGLPHRLGALPAELRMGRQ
jgi:hypothetical protein